MRFEFSFSSALFVVIMGCAVLSQCVFLPEHTRAIQRELEDEEKRWPKTYLTAFEVIEDGEITSALDTELLGANRTFTSPACSRLQVAAADGGETYSGHMLRERLRYSACSRVKPRSDVYWEWPWRHGLPQSELPPSLRAKFGAWRLRCTKSGAPTRCALVQTIAPTTEGAPSITTHITLTHVRDRLVPVWRLWVARENESWFRGLTPEGIAQWDRLISECMRQAKRFSGCLNAARERFSARRTREVWISRQSEQRQINFTRCTELGCMLETPIEISASVVADLMHDRKLMLTLHPLADIPFNFEIDGKNFKRALQALSTIDQRANATHTQSDGRAL